jgi:hypothetical protein
MDPDHPAPRRRTCGLCAQQGHDRRHCRAADLYMAAHPELNQGLRALYRNEIVAFAAAGLPPVPEPLPRVRCITNQNHAHWGDRFQCQNMSVPGGQYCARCDATRPRPDLPPHQRCRMAHCMCIIAERNLCKRHLMRDIMRRKTAHVNNAWVLAVEQMEIDPTSWPQIVQGWADYMPPAELGPTTWWRNQIRGLRIRLAGEYFIRDLWNMDHPRDLMDVNGVIDWHWNHNRAAAVAPAGTLAAFVADGQNVHTGVVSNQTHEGVKKLLALPIPSGQSEVTKTFVRKLLKVFTDSKSISERDSARLYQDFDHWYKQETCRMHNDWLYKRIIDGVIHLICGKSDKEVRFELYKRLFEEMRDSLGMCCDGHITRLINVFAGFDDAFAPEKSVAEKVQELFAALSVKESSLLEKVAEGVRELRKLKVPEDEWEPWIDAL